MHKTTSRNWSGAYAQQAPIIGGKAWRGASGLMMYIDMSEATGTDSAGFDLDIQFGLKRYQSWGTSPGGSLRFGTTGASKWNNANAATIYANATSTAYIFDETTQTWKAFSSTFKDNLFNNTTTNDSGWYYIPFTSLFSRGASGTDGADHSDAATYGSNNDNTTGKTFAEVMPLLVSKWADTTQIYYTGMAAGQKTSDIYYVYPTEEVSLNAASVPIFGNSEGSFGDGVTYDWEDTDGLGVTLSGTNTNSKTVMQQNIFAQSGTSLAGASALKVYVDTSELDEGARLRMRFRFQYRSKPSNKCPQNWLYGQTAGYANPTSESWMMWVISSPGALAYYYGDNGVNGTVQMDSDVALKGDNAAQAQTADLFEPLPAGFKGYVVIPMSNFWLNLYTGSYNIEGRVPYDMIEAKDPALCNADAFFISSAIEGETESNTVTYKDLSLVYEDLEATKASVTLENDLSLNVVAEASEKVTGVSATFKMNGKTLGSEVNEVTGGYELTAKDILPQNVADKIDVTVSGKIGGRTAKTELSLSIKDYCLKLLEKGDATAAEKNIAADLLRYAAAAQTYADYKTDALATADVTLTGLGSAVDKDAIVPQYALSGTADASYAFTEMALRLEGRLAVKLTLKAASTENLTVTVTVNGRAHTYTAEDLTAVAGEENTYTVICNDVGADEMNATITAAMTVDETASGQTLTVSVADYVKTALNNTALSEKEAALIEALYAYGLSAAAIAQ